MSAFDNLGIAAFLCHYGGRKLKQGFYNMKKHLLVLAMAGLWTTQALALDLDNDKKRFSYIIGLQIGQQLKGDNIDLDEQAFMAAIRDMAAGKQPRLSKSEIQAVLQKVQQQRAAEAQKAADENRRKGQEFLSVNSKKAGVKTLPSGLQYKVIRAGTGKSPKATDTVKVDYRGTLIDGTVFDSSYKRGQPATFPVNGVIKGWTEALQLMKEGAKWQIYVPSELAYGPRGAGGQIGPNETLIFDVELLSIKDQ